MGGFLKLAWGWISGSWFEVLFYGVIAAAVAGAWYHYTSVVAERDSLRGDLAVSKQLAADNADFALSVIDQSAAAVSAVERTDKAVAGDAKASTIIVTKVLRVKAEPLSPVLSCYLGLLRSGQDDRDSEAADVHAQGSTVAARLQDACTPAS